MHVLLVAQWPRRFSPGNFQWPNDAVEALRRLGHRVTTCCNRESWAESPAITARLGAGGAAPAWLMRWHAAGQRRRDRRVVTLVQQHRPDLVLLLNGALISAEGLREVRRATPGCLVSWWADDPWLDAAFMASVDVFDHVCVFDRAYIPRLRSAGAAQVHFLPCACNERVYVPLRLRPMEQRRFACDVSFVGWYYPERGPVMGALARDADVQLGIWGGQWNSPEARRALHGASVVRGAAVSDRTAAKIYNASKIGINVHARHSLLAGVNTRTFELLASGLFQLVDSIAGIDELLAPGREVVCYTSPEEARVLAKRYLADPAERAAIAARGRERTLAEHTYVCRMRTLLDVVGG